MTPPFSVRTTPHFDRLCRRLLKGHPDLPDRYAEALEILGSDPYNRSRHYAVKKLMGVEAGDGQFRLRLARWRFRYDIFGQEVVLHYCGLRREDTYR